MIWKSISPNIHLFRLIPFPSLTNGEREDRIWWRKMGESRYFYSFVICFLYNRGIIVIHYYLLFLFFQFFSTKRGNVYSFSLLTLFFRLSTKKHMKKNFFPLILILLSSLIFRHHCILSSLLRKNFRYSRSMKKWCSFISHL